jgi:hypothetical protein
MRAILLVGCALVASGHAATNAVTILMKSRRLILAPRGQERYRIERTLGDNAFNITNRRFIRWQP